MKEFIVSQAQAGQKAVKYCMKILPQAQPSFLHKMMRKKNITRNGKKLDGSDILNAGDCIRFFFADETFAKFAAHGQTQALVRTGQPAFAPHGLRKERILYEDADVLLYDKPAGMLSQKAKPADVSLNEYFLQYLLESGQLDTGQLHVLKPSVCNRLDRNTSGLVICGKSYRGLTAMNEMLRDRSLRKFYRCIVAGQMREPVFVRGYLKKDETGNKVEIRPNHFAGAASIETEIKPLQTGSAFSLAQIHLITGKTHQIRAHLAYLGHPIVGDHKYGDRALNDRLRREYGLACQLLHAYRLEIPEDVQTLPQLAGRSFHAPIPQLFSAVQQSIL